MRLLLEGKSPCAARPYRHAIQDPHPRIIAWPASLWRSAVRRLPCAAGGFATAAFQCLAMSGRGPDYRRLRISPTDRLGDQPETAIKAEDDRPAERGCGDVYGDPGVTVRALRPISGPNNSSSNSEAPLTTLVVRAKSRAASIASIRMSAFPSCSAASATAFRFIFPLAPSVAKSFQRIKRAPALARGHCRGRGSAGGSATFRLR